MCKIITYLVATDMPRKTWFKYNAEFCHSSSTDVIADAF